MDDGSGWKPDPTGRHQERFFTANGIPTNRVRNDGVEATDEDRVASASSQELRRIVARPIPPPSSTGVTKPWNETRLISRHVSPADPDPMHDALTGQVPAVAVQQARPVAVRQRPWWLIAATGVLILLAITAGLFALQQHNQANKWIREYHVEVSEDQTATRKDIALFASLLTSQQNLSAVTNQKDAACLVLESILRDASSTVAACAG